MNENRKYKCIYILLGIMTFICGAILLDAILIFTITLNANSIQQSPIRTIFLTILPALLFGGVTYLFLRYEKRNAETEFTRMGKYYVLLVLLSWVMGIIWFMLWWTFVYVVLSFFSGIPWYIDILCTILLILPIHILTILLCLFRVYGIDHFKCWSWKFSFLNLIVATTCTASSLFLVYYILWYT